MFDLGRDPGELTDLIDSRPEEARALGAELADWRGRTLPLAAPVASEQQPDPETLQKLKSLGYVN